jgi:hypothetical protein
MKLFVLFRDDPTSPLSDLMKAGWRPHRMEGRLMAHLGSAAAAFDGRSRFKTGNWKAVTPLRL